MHSVTQEERMGGRHWSAIAVGLAALGALMPSAAAAPRAPAAMCVNALVDHVDVPGLTVPAGAYCDVVGAHVGGSVEVGRAASLSVVSSRVVGPTMSQGSVEFRSSTSDSAITEIGGTDLAVTLSHVAGLVGGQVNINLWIAQSSIGAIKAGHEPAPAGAGQETVPATIRGDHIRGDVSLDLARGQIAETEIDGDVSLGSLAEFTVCGVHIRGDLDITGQQAGTTLTLGGAPRGAGCSNGGTVVVDGSVNITDNDGIVKLKSVTIGHGLNCTGNLHHPQLGDVGITGGNRSGQCVRPLP
jgi:hypothetical protein